MRVDKFPPKVKFPQKVTIHPQFVNLFPEMILILQNMYDTG